MAENTIVVTRELFSSGNSTVLTIPPDILEEAGFELGDEVAFNVDDDGGIVLRDAERGTDASISE
jgi:antitoxin component of MazEF toxin-antitoxin module